MQIELFSRSKRRASDKPGDDVAVVLPGTVYAVLDGATDPTGREYGGESSGRIAARSAATALVDLLLTGGPDVELAQIGAVLSQQVARAASAVGASHPPSTTLAAAIQRPEGFRLLLIGDSGIRVNGSEVFQNDKLIDDISAMSRLAVRTELAKTITDPDDLEHAGRKVSFAGMDAAVTEGMIDSATARGIIAAMQGRFAPQIGSHAADLEVFLRGGISAQPRFANDPDHPLGSASINADLPRGYGITDHHLRKEDLRSLEIFSDGYFGLPEGTHVQDWETRFAEIEMEDPHKTGPYPEVKGSFGAEFSDDRTVLCLHREG